MGNSISDILYPDNPNRRARANQLKADIEAFCNEFKDFERQRAELLKELNPRLGQFLKQNGYNSPEELDEKVQSILRGQALADYNEVKKKYNKDSDLESTLFQLCGVVSVATGVFVLTLRALTIISGGTALAALEVIGGVLGVVSLCVVFFAIFEGAEERANLRDAINKLAPERVKARQALMEMKTICMWISSIKDWLDDPDISGNPEIMKKLLDGDFKNDFAEADRAHVIEYLVKFDSDRRAWTKEDPYWKNPSASSSYHSLPDGLSQNSSDEAKAEACKLMVTYGNKQGNNEVGSLSLSVMDCTKKSATATDAKGDKWSLIVDSPLLKFDKVYGQIGEYQFSLKNLQSGHTLVGCRVTSFVGEA